MKSNDQSLALLAMVSASNLESDSVPILIQGLTNQHADVRNEAAHMLGSLPSLAGFEERKMAIPALIVLLNDPFEYARMNASNTLKEIDPVAAAKAGIK